MSQSKALAKARQNGFGRGSRRIEMKRIESEDGRFISFCKRKKGLFLKASDLSTLTGAHVSILAYSPAGKPYTFGTPDFNSITDKFLIPNDGGGVDLGACGVDSGLNEELMELTEELDVKTKQNLILKKQVREMVTRQKDFKWIERVDQLDDIQELSRFEQSLQYIKRLADARANEILGNGHRSEEMEPPRYSQSNQVMIRRSANIPIDSLSQSESSSNQIIRTTDLNGYGCVSRSRLTRPNQVSFSGQSVNRFVDQVSLNTFEPFQPTIMANFLEQDQIFQSHPIANSFEIAGMDQQNQLINMVNHFDPTSIQSSAVPNDPFELIRMVQRNCTTFNPFVPNQINRPNEITTSLFEQTMMNSQIPTRMFNNLGLIIQPIHVANPTDSGNIQYSSMVNFSELGEFQPN